MVKLTLNSTACSCISRVCLSKGNFFFLFFTAFCFCLNLFFSNKLVFIFFHILTLKLLKTIFLLINTIRTSTDTKSQCNMLDSCTINIDTFKKTSTSRIESIQCNNFFFFITPPKKKFAFGSSRIT